MFNGDLLYMQTQTISVSPLYSDTEVPRIRVKYYSTPDELTFF